MPARKLLTFASLTAGPWPIGVTGRTAPRRIINFDGETVLRTPTLIRSNMLACNAALDTCRVAIVIRDCYKYRECQGGFLQPINRAPGARAPSPSATASASLPGCGVRIAFQATIFAVMELTTLAMIGPALAWLVRFGEAHRCCQTLKISLKTERMNLAELEGSPQDNLALRRVELVQAVRLLSSVCPV
jgi:hypothetical protein